MLRALALTGAGGGVVALALMTARAGSGGMALRLVGARIVVRRPGPSPPLPLVLPLALALVILQDLLVLVGLLPVLLLLLPLVVPGAGMGGVVAVPPAGIGRGRPSEPPTSRREYDEDQRSP